MSQDSLQRFIKHAARHAQSLTYSATSPADRLAVSATKLAEGNFLDNLGKSIHHNFTGSGGYTDSIKQFGKDTAHNTNAYLNPVAYGSRIGDGLNNMESSARTDKLYEEGKDIQGAFSTAGDLMSNMFSSAFNTDAKNPYKANMKAVNKSVGVAKTPISQAFGGKGQKSNPYSQWITGTASNPYSNVSGQ